MMMCKVQSTWRKSMHAGRCGELFLYHLLCMVTYCSRDGAGASSAVAYEPMTAVLGLALQRPPGTGSRGFASCSHSQRIDIGHRRASDQPDQPSVSLPSPTLVMFDT